MRLPWATDNRINYFLLFCALNANIIPKSKYGLIFV